MAWFVYVIKSEIDGRLYKGMSEDVSARLAIHNKGKVSSTKAYRPWKLVYSEPCEDSVKAREREKYFKSSKGRDFLKSRGIHLMAILKGRMVISAGTGMAGKKVRKEPSPTV